MKQPVFIDTDMGVDDILAIGLLLLSNKYDIRGVSIVNGVASTKRGIINAASILRAFQCEAPLFRGLTQKQQNSRVQFPSLDRKRANNLTLVSQPLPSQKPQASSLKQANKLIIQEKKSFTLFCLGPLSNVNILLQNAKTTKKIGRLVIMGGAVFVKGNVAPTNVAEYNIRLDVSSAKNVFNLPTEKLLIPVDATSYAPAKRTLKTKKESIPYLLNFLRWIKSYSPVTKTGMILKDIILNNTNDFVSFYDPLAVLAYINPAIITGNKKGSITVSTNKNSFGKTTFASTSKPNTTIVTQINTKLFFEEFKKLLQKG